MSDSKSETVVDLVQRRPRKILLAFDGTLNNVRDFTPNKEEDRNFTHILRLHLFAGGDINGDTRDADDKNQISLYEVGVGGETENTALGMLRAVGGNISGRIEDMKKRLEAVYQPGDRLYLVGFSRGAASARKLAADLYDNGLTCMKNGEVVERPPIEFMGCFDTVSLQITAQPLQLLVTKYLHGIPSSGAVGEKGFIAPNVKRAVHNVSIDDNRMWRGSPFTFNPTLMGNEEKVTETWFAGEHGDVGGSYYSKGMPDCSLEYMMEWMEGGDLGEGNNLEFLKAQDIDPANLIMNGFPEIQIDAADLSVSPDTADTLHLKLKEQNEPNNPSYRPIYVVQNDEVVENATVKIHVSALQHMEDMKKVGKKYLMNPNIKDTDFVVVGPLGRELEDETKKLSDNLKTDYY